MRFSALAVNVSMFALFTAAALAQNGTITGTVINPAGEPVANAPVQARDSKSSAVFKASTSAKGAYTLANLPAGAYDLSVNVGGLRGFERKSVSLGPAASLRIDIHLEEGTQLSTLGEDPLAILANQKLHAAPSGPAPRTLGGKPDFSGVWWSPATVDPGKPEFLPQAEAAAKKRMDDNRVDSPQSHCMPAAATRLGPLYELVQSPEFIVEISDDDSPGFHQIYLDGHKHPADPNPAWYGHNVGHWEGDTLVVDRVAFDSRVWLDQGGHPHSGQLHIIERYRRPDLGHLETEITVEDPGVLAKPFTQKRVSELAAGMEINEFICTENERDNRHFVR
jgi:hypothetical protein